MKILVCVDGERHTHAAIERAISLALSGSGELTGLHVIDPWLKQFYDEIYAQGRKEYLDYVDERLEAIANEIREEFTGMCRAAGLEADYRVRRGDPLNEILAEVRDSAPDRIFTGARELSAWERFRSGNLPARLRKGLNDRIPLATVTTPVASQPISRGVETGAGGADAGARSAANGR